MPADTRNLPGMNNNPLGGLSPYSGTPGTERFRPSGPTSPTSGGQRWTPVVPWQGAGLPSGSPSQIGQLVQDSLNRIFGGGAAGGGNTLTLGGQSFSLPGAIPNPLVAALQRDIEAQQGAADRQFARNNDMISGIQQFLGGVPGMLGGAAQGFSDELGGIASGLEGLGSAQHGAFLDQAGGVMQGLDQGLGGLFGNIDSIQGGIDSAIGGIQGAIDGVGDINYDSISGMVREGISAADRAAAGFKQAINEYQDRSAQDASVVAAGIARRGHTAMKMASSGMRADGTPMTAAEQASAISQIQGQVAQEVQTATTQIFSQYNSNRAQLEQGLAEVRMAAANTRFTGAQIEAGLAELKQRGFGLQMEGFNQILNANNLKLNAEQLRLGGIDLRAKVALSITDQFLESQRGQRELAQVAAGLRAQGVDIRNAAVLNATNLQFQGLLNLAQLVQQNPESVVSWFQGLLSMYSLGAAMQGRAVG